MHIRIGVDIVGIARVERIIARWGDRFLARVFTARELDDCQGRPESLAARFAAKEAVLKALGTGLDRGICWHDVEVVRTSKGPHILLRGVAEQEARVQGLIYWSVSLTHSDGIAAAVAVGYGANHEAHNKASASPHSRAGDVHHPGQHRTG